MSTTSVLIHDNGAVEVMDWSFAPEEVTPAFAEYLTAKDTADSDFDQGRLDSHERWTGPALTAASDRLREACSLRFESLDDFEAHIIRETNALRNARRAQAERAS